MHVVYAAESSLDAHLVKGLLEQRGVPVRLVGHHLEGGIGELPAGGLVQLLVPDEDWVETARAVIEDYEARRTGDVQGEGETLWPEFAAGGRHKGEEDAEPPAAWGLGTRDWLLITGALALLVLLLFGGAR